MNFRNLVDSSGAGSVEDLADTSVAVSRRGGSRGNRLRRSQWREKQYYCPKCGRGFTLKSNLKRHYTYECGFGPRYKCPYCDLKSKQTSQVYSHIRNKHPGEQVFYVDIMGEDGSKNN